MVPFDKPGLIPSTTMIGQTSRHSRFIIPMHRENAYFQGQYDWIQIKSFCSETYNAKFQSILNSPS